MRCRNEVSKKCENDSQLPFSKTLSEDFIRKGTYRAYVTKNNIPFSKCVFI